MWQKQIEFNLPRSYLIRIFSKLAATHVPLHPQNHSTGSIAFKGPGLHRFSPKLGHKFGCLWGLFWFGIWGVEWLDRTNTEDKGPLIF